MVASHASLTSIAMVEAVLPCLDDRHCFFIAFRADFPHGVGTCGLDASGFSFYLGLDTHVFARTDV